MAGTQKSSNFGDRSHAIVGNWPIALVAVAMLAVAAACGQTSSSSPEVSITRSEPQASQAQPTVEVIASPTEAASPTLLPSPTPIPCISTVIPPDLCESARAVWVPGSTDTGLSAVVLRLPVGTEIQSPIAGTAAVYRDAAGEIMAIGVSDNVCSVIDGSAANLMRFRFDSAATAPFPRRTTVPDGRDFGYAEVAENTVVAIIGSGTGELLGYPGFNVVISGTTELMQATFPAAFRDAPVTPVPDTNQPPLIGPAIFASGGKVDYQGHSCRQPAAR